MTWIRSDAWVLLLPVGFLAWQWIRSVIRKREIQNLAKLLGFHYLGDALPRSFSLLVEPLHSITSIWNVIDGEPRGRRILVFDCRFGSGKGGWLRTIFAVENKERDDSPFKYESLQTKQVGDWIILWRPKEFGRITAGLTPTDELRAYLEFL